MKEMEDAHQLDIQLNLAKKPAITRLVLANSTEKKLKSV